MNKKVILSSGKWGRLEDKEPFLLPGELTLEFKTVGYSLTNGFVTLKNGNEEERYRLTPFFKIPDKFLFAGILSISVDVYKGNTCINRWEIFPLRIIETEGDTFVYDYMYALEERIAALEEQLPKNIF